MFGKKKSVTLDEHLTFMSADDAAELRARLAKEFAAQGTPVEIHIDHVTAASGEQYGLWNLAAMCHNAPRGRKHWDAIIRNHVSTLLNPRPDPSTLSDEELLRIVHARVYDADAMAQIRQEFGDGAREVAEGIVAMLVADFPDVVTSIGPEEIARRDAAALWEAGLANTKLVAIEAVAGLKAPSGVEIKVAMGESFYLASRILDMPGLLADVFGPRDYPHGVLVGVAHRHQVVLLPLDSADAVTAVGMAADYTARGYSDAPGAVSPLLYWWGGDGFQAVSSIDKKGAISILGEGPFLDAVNAAVGEGH